MRYTITTTNKDEHWAAFHGMDLYLALLDLDEWLRNKLKYPPRDMVDGEATAYEITREKLREIMDNRGVDFEHVS
jgi:hypothetical protein